MSDVKWIKISTNMFEDEKIKIIEQLPEADTILIIWVKLLVQAGKTNASGYIFLSEKIPYSDEMLATIFNRPLNTVRLALKTFEQFGMIEISEQKLINICNWEKHQNIEGLERIRKQNRERVQKHRELKKLGQKDVTLPVTQGNAIEEDIDKEIEEEKKINIPYMEIIDYLNQKTDSNFKSKSNGNKKLIKARWSEGFTLNDFKIVIDFCVSEWKGTTFSNGAKGDDYLRPSTLFNSKFDERLNIAKKKNKNKQKQDTKSERQEHNYGF